MRVKNRRHTGEGGLFGRDDEGRNASKVAAEAAAVFKARAKSRAVKVLAQPRHDAAADVDAAHGTERHRHVACGRTQHGAKGVERVAAHGVTASQRAACDLGRAQPRIGRTRLARTFGQRFMNQLEPGARQQALERDVAMLTPCETQDRQFTLVTRREADMPAFRAE